MTYDALLVASFGGPESRDEVGPFLDRVLAGKNVPQDRKREVAQQYYVFDGVSPLNQQNRQLISCLQYGLRQRGVSLPIYWGNRFSAPYFNDVLAEIALAKHLNIILYVTSAYSSYSSCRAYREDLNRALDDVGLPIVTFDKIRAFYNHPKFIGAIADRIQCVESFDRSQTHLLFTAHSIPMVMASKSDYSLQLQEACSLVASNLGCQRWSLAFQSRSGRPQDLWLEPDVQSAVKSLQQKGIDRVVVCPIGFLSDHMEVKYDLDVSLAHAMTSLNMQYVRAETVGSHPIFIDMILDLVDEKIHPDRPKDFLGSRGANWDVCPENCCALL